MIQYKANRKLVIIQIAAFLLFIIIIWCISILIINLFFSQRYLVLTLCYPLYAGIYIPAYTRRFHYSLVINGYGFDISNDLMSPYQSIHWTDIDFMKISFLGILKIQMYNGQVIRLRKNISEYKQAIQEILLKFTAFKESSNSC